MNNLHKVVHEVERPGVIPATYWPGALTTPPRHTGVYGGKKFVEEVAGYK